MSLDTLTAATARSGRTARPHGFDLLFKEADAPWIPAAVFLDGRTPRSGYEVLRVQQALMSGLILGIGHPTEDLPYRLVCNEDGHGLSMSRNVDMLGGRSLVGPVLLVRYKREKAGWSPVSMDLRSGTAPHLEALRRLVGMPLHSDDIVANRIRTLDVTTAAHAEGASHE